MVVVVGERGIVDGSVGSLSVLVAASANGDVPERAAVGPEAAAAFAEVATLREESLSTACHVLSDARQWETFFLIFLNDFLLIFQACKCVRFYSALPLNFFPHLAPLNSKSTAQITRPHMYG